MLSCRTKTVISLLFILFVFLNLSDKKENQSRPAHWAKPVSLPGVPNLFQVSESLYRSGQPERQGFDELHRFGIKTIVNLRHDHSDKPWIEPVNFIYFEIPSRANRVREKDVIRFLSIVTDPTLSPCLVHCQHGADRTGLMVAMYRIVIQGWPKNEAINELKEGGFGFHKIYINITNFLKKVDAEHYRQVLGLPPLEITVKSDFLTSSQLATSGSAL